jgi:trehalose 6-phosphate phosphatase
MCFPKRLRHPPPLAREATILLDFDGTLVALADRPDAVVVDDALTALLRALIARHQGRVALVSGRSIAQLDGFFGAAAGTFAVIGSHGAEIRHQGTLLSGMARPSALDIAAASFASAFADRPGVVIEEKSLGVAVHYRLDPAAEAPVVATVAAFAKAHALAVQPGKMMVELFLPGHDKGRAIATLMREAPFAGHLPVFAGDDLTDEPGFAVCAALGGAGILVGPERPTAAGFGLADPEAVRNWLTAQPADSRQQTASENRP